MPNAIAGPYSPLATSLFAYRSERKTYTPKPIQPPLRPKPRAKTNRNAHGIIRKQPNISPNLLPSQASQDAITVRRDGIKDWGSYCRLMRSISRLPGTCVDCGTVLRGRVFFSCEAGSSALVLCLKPTRLTQPYSAVCTCCSLHVRMTYFTVDNISPITSCWQVVRCEHASQHSIFDIPIS